MFYNFIKNFFTKKEPNISNTKGMLVFENTSEVIFAEKILKENGFNVSVMGPPPELRTGCDMIIEFPLIMEMEFTRILSKNKIPPLKVVPVCDIMLKPVDIYHSKDLGKWLMVRAANMKITIRKKDLEIVNISGGGCPDVPYLAAILNGKKINEFSENHIQGHTLCGYALKLAYKELKRKCC